MTIIPIVIAIILILAGAFIYARAKFNKPGGEKEKTGFEGNTKTIRTTPGNDAIS